MVALAGVGILLMIAGFFSFAHAAAWQNSETLFLSVLESYPNSLTARNNLGMEYLYRNQNDKALAEFNTLLGQHTWPITLVNRGLLYFREGKISEAIADYQKAIERDPLYYDAYYELGNIAYQAGDLPKAATLFTKAYELNPQYTNALNNLGGAYMRMHEWKKAIDTLKKLLAQNPVFTEGYYNLAVAYEQTGRFNDAAQMYQSALDLNPDDPDALSGLARARNHQR